MALYFVISEEAFFDSSPAVNRILLLKLTPTCNFSYIDAIADLLDLE